MGHYRSEMVCDETEARERREKQQARDRVAEAIRKDIAARGVEHVLADILCDPTLYKIQHRG